MDPLAVLGMDKREKRVEGQVTVRRNAKQIAGLVRDPEVTGLQIQLPQARVGGRCRQAQARLAFAQRLIRAFPGECVGKHLRDQSEALYQRLRPGSLLPHRIEAQYAKDRLASRRERKHYRGLDAILAPNLLVPGCFCGEIRVPRNDE